MRKNMGIIWTQRSPEQA